MPQWQGVMIKNNEITTVTGTETKNYQTKQQTNPIFNRKKQENGNKRHCQIRPNTTTGG